MARQLSCEEEVLWCRLRVVQCHFRQLASESMESDRVRTGCWSGVNRENQSGIMREKTFFFASNPHEFGRHQNSKSQYRIAKQAVEIPAHNKVYYRSRTKTDESIENQRRCTAANLKHEIKRMISFPCSTPIEGIIEE